ncbi:hypothetical protein DCAR_0104061 [Daucus carota subsp. sativus]|uniref:Uncharacterized protein n=1 Tax=Daucus carota subsp. sativus TaxID=79200 RepID=A0A166IIP2_DAUCS|nr:hypothetical protein DCAR_0104061 [Daucus carota subsp. sativus]
MASQCSSTMLKAIFLLSFLVATALIGTSEARQLTEKPEENAGHAAKVMEPKENDAVAHVTQTSEGPSSPSFPFNIPPFPRLQIPGLPPCPLPTFPFPLLGGAPPPPRN